MSEENPFSALFSGSSSTLKPIKSTPLEDIIEEVFGFTINPKHAETKQLLLLEEMQQNFNADSLNLEILSHALFDRLFMCTSGKEQFSGYSNKKLHGTNAGEYRILVYLYHSYEKLHRTPDLDSKDKAVIDDLILQNATTAMLQPEIYEGQDLYQQMIDIVKDSSGSSRTFFSLIVQRLEKEENEGIEKLEQFLTHMINILRLQVIKSSIINFDLDIFNVLKVFTLNATVGNIFLDKVQPQRANIGSDFAITLLGALFNISVLPKVPSEKYEYFSDPMNNASNRQQEDVLWSTSKRINEGLQEFVLSLLKCNPQVKQRTLSWLGSSLNGNADRGKLWNAQAPPELNPANYTNVTDGFMINLSNLLLHLCKPFCTNVSDGKILRVDPTYCAVPNSDTSSKDIHIQNLSEETCFISCEDESERPTSSSYNFMTECFFFTHKALDLGYRVAVEKLIRMNHEMGRIERAYNDAMQQAGGNRDFVDSIQDRMKAELVKYFSLKCQISDPTFSSVLFDFISATTYWLNRVANCSHFSDSTSLLQTKDEHLKFPMSDDIPSTLRCIPEFLVENVVTHLVFLRRFNQKLFESHGYERMKPILSFILIFMRSQDYLKNPHIRARLAEGLESLLPSHKDDRERKTFGYEREKLFTLHEHKLEIVESLLNVFVAIEMTGQSVEFEQKFNYRRPMYNIIEYLWKMDEHVNCFLKLAEDAEKNMEAVNPPLFLRFANLLMNDAIYLLDEALSNMAKIKEMQQAQDNGEWSQLAERERTQNISYMHHLGMMARFNNILGSDTISILEKLTSVITIVFTHPTMVDRVASMLNYFLLHLVGPNQKNFKVKHSEEYNFDPAATVLEICKIYTHLKKCPEFCLAVSQDGRSYSPKLFTYAEDILARIGGGGLIGEMQEFAQIVAAKAEEYKANEEAVAEAPEHFLDPIMSTLMMDPVILPSSKQTVDRTTIARHLLSDQTDPFNRSPLSMDQVIPNTDLCNQIKQWLNNWISNNSNK